jgi:putative tricarboxylic transport membrane protein
MSKQANLPTICVAACLLAASVVLAFFFIAPGADSSLEARGGVGPTTWPKVMLLCIACCAAILLVRELPRLFAASARATVAAERGVSAYDNWKAVLGITLLVLYGVAVPLVGFALATVLFFMAWLAFGGLRKPLTIGLISVLGTVGLLYIFAGLSKMPLDRGVGVFDGVTIVLYRVLGIY